MAFTNFEMLLHDYEPYPPHIKVEAYCRAKPSMAKELVWAGFDMVSTATIIIPVIMELGRYETDIKIFK